jgi:hypothetical protein
MAHIHLDYDDVHELAKMLAALAEIDESDLTTPLEEMRKANESDSDDTAIVIDDEGITWDDNPDAAAEEQLD